MKKLLLAFTLFLSFNSLFASHLAGGEIWYEYAGTTVSPNRYKVYLQIYRDMNGLTLCGSTNCPQTVCISSSCFSNQSITLSLEPFKIMPGSDTVLATNGGIITPGISSCVLNSSVVTEQFLFSTEVDLPGKCSDFTFSFSANARNPSDNLLNGTAANLYLEAKLNNTIANNTSPVFLSPAIKSFCVGKSFEWSHEAYDADGDSLFYFLSNPADGTCGQPPVPIDYTTGYDQAHPITSSPPLALNVSNGMTSFTPVNQEVITFRLDIKEYRRGSSSFFLIGQTMRDIQIPIVSANNCANHDDQSLINDSTMFRDSIPPISCNDTSIFVKFNQEILISSIASDGSDFAVTNSYGQLIPVKSATSSGKRHSSSYTYGVHLNLFTPVLYNDSIHVTIRKGSDLNTLINTCGYEIKKGDSLSYLIEGCLTSIGLEENSLPNFSIFPNPTSDEINLRSSQSILNSILQVYSSQGALIKETIISTETPVINIKNLPAGVYYIKLSNGVITENLPFQKL